MPVHSFEWKCNPYPYICIKERAFFCVFQVSMFYIITYTIKPKSKIKKKYIQTVVLSVLFMNFDKKSSSVIMQKENTTIDEKIKMN